MTKEEFLENINIGLKDKLVLLEEGEKDKYLFPSISCGKYCSLGDVKVFQKNNGFFITLNGKDYEVRERISFFSRKKKS